MPVVRVTIDLPYHLVLPDGEYSFAPGDVITLAERLEIADQPRDSRVRTSVGRVFEVDEDIDSEAAGAVAAREATSTLRRTNRLLRWYRQLALRPYAMEVTRAQVSPFQFENVATHQPWLVPVLEFEADRVAIANFGTIGQLADAIRQKLLQGGEPAVSQLTLLDAEHAQRTGRFREAVLLSWSVIDSAFIGKFNLLVDEHLSGEWAESRRFLKDNDLGLRHKMAIGLRLVAGRSLFDEPNGFWDDLSASYGKRNRIIHEGELADEDDARKAIDVARRVIAVVATL